jgi:hypothetical protein
MFEFLSDLKDPETSPPTLTVFAEETFQERQQNFTI